MAWKELEREATKKSLWNCGRRKSAQHRMVGQRGLWWCRSMLLCGGFTATGWKMITNKKMPKGLSAYSDGINIHFLIMDVYNNTAK